MKTRKVKLDLQNRVALIDVLPSEGNYSDIKLCQQLKEQIEPTVEEAQKVNFKMGQGYATWSEKKAKELGEREFEIDELTCAVLSKTLRGLSDKSKLKPTQIEIYEVFAVGQDK